MTNNKIEKMIAPKSIAIVGASTRESAVGYKITRNLIDGGYKGKLFLINPKYETGFGLKFYQDLAELKTVPDLVILCIPKNLVLETIDKMSQIGAKSVLILSAGFKESGEEGAELEQQLVQKLQEHNISAIGPNTIGIVNTSTSVKMNATFTKCSPQKGSIALISQSGALGASIVNLCSNHGLGVSKMISIGNQCDLTVNDFIEYFGEDKSVKEIVLYIESIKNPNEFKKVCQKVSKTKPIFVIKAGSSQSGSQATMSHTGSMAGKDAFNDAMIKQSDAIRVIELGEMLNLCYAHSMLSRNVGSNLSIVTNGMGPAILASDNLDGYGLKLSKLSDELKQKLKSKLSPLASVANPIDLNAAASIDEYKSALRLLLQNDKVDTILVIYLELFDTKCREYQQLFEKLQMAYPNKSILSVYITNDEEYAFVKANAKRVPVFNLTEYACEAINGLTKYSTSHSHKFSKSKITLKNKEKIQKIVDCAKTESRKILTTKESLEVLNLLEIPTVSMEASLNMTQIMQSVNKFSFPMVLKISSKTITHKSDMNGVILNITDREMLKNKINELTYSLQKMNEYENLDGFIIQPMCHSKREVVVGMTRDANFGAVIMFGQGGIFVEQQKDVSFKVSPLCEQDINDQINSIKYSTTMGSVRGLSKTNLDAIKSCLRGVDWLAQQFDEIVEVDINPLMIDDKTGEVFAVDARIILK